jgi:alpha-ketoglutaric semialdehyde dehydrogenase
MPVSASMPSHLFLNHINGEWVSSQAGATFENRNPANPSDSLGRFPASVAADVHQAIAAAKAALPAWSQTPAPKRGEILLKLADSLKAKKAEWSPWMGREMGKTFTEAGGDIQEAIDMAIYMGAEGRRLFGHTTPSELRQKLCWTQRTPVGVCGLITPWNFPIAVPSWKILPALVAGNTIVWKPSEDSPLMANLFMEALIEAGLPKGVVNVVHGDGPTAGQPLVEHPEVRLVSFTGSTAVGKLIGGICGTQLKKSCLELGGKNAALVMDDANLDLAVDGLVWGAFGTSGQRCTATSRIIVHRNVKQALVARMIEKMKGLVIGNPQLPETQVGPVINAEAHQRILKEIELALAEGATLLAGGKAIPSPEGGYFIEPTLLGNISPSMRVAQTELFGPVACLIEVDSFDEAIEVANDSDYGLSSAIYTRNINQALQATQTLETGITYVNAPTIGAEVHLPFGGVKNTGNGHREAAWATLDVYTEWKTIYIDFSDKLQRAQIDS